MAEGVHIHVVAVCLSLHKPFYGIEAINTYLLGYAFRVFAELVGKFAAHIHHSGHYCISHIGRHCLCTVRAI